VAAGPTALQGPPFGEKLQAFFRSAKAVTGITPERVTTDGHGSYPRAIRSTLGRRVAHRTSAYKNNGPEQDHQGVKGRTRCMRGFKSFVAAERFCRSDDELRDFLRPCARHNQPVTANCRLTDMAEILALAGFTPQPGSIFPQRGTT
jgi:DDE domain